MQLKYYVFVLKIIEHQTLEMIHIRQYQQNEPQ